jgi:hypothetical protein
MSTTSIHRRPAGSSRGGQFAPCAQDDQAGGLDDAGSTASGTGGPVVAKDTVYTARYATKEEKLAAIHGELEKHVAGLGDDQNWQDSSTP